MLPLRGWVGTPVIKRGDEVFDGSIRLEAWELGKFPGTPPIRVATTARELAKLLVLCGETTRAQQLLGGTLDDYATAQAILRLDRELSEGVVDCRKRGKARDYSSKHAVIRLRRFLENAQEDNIPITLEALKQVMGDVL